LARFSCKIGSLFVGTPTAYIGNSYTYIEREKSWKKACVEVFAIEKPEKRGYLAINSAISEFPGLYSLVLIGLNFTLW
jgi:hypothetical protein